MKIEDEIKQEEFKSPQHKLFINLMYTVNYLGYNLHHHLKKLDITAQQYNVLRILRGQYPKPCNLKLIKERSIDRMSDSSRIIDKLIQKKWAERTECPNDRRQINILLTKKGQDILKKLDFVDQETIELFINLSEQEIKLMNNLLDKIRD
ncbi:MAG: MarR family transcriptional regulator [Sphingobacteriaceae bacterium]|nr:MarR family transcriptional regulator [Sphingobacteriaceae bacterium]